MSGVNIETIHEVRQNEEEQAWEVMTLPTIQPHHTQDLILTSTNSDINSNHSSINQNFNSSNIFNPNNSTIYDHSTTNNNENYFFSESSEQSIVSGSQIHKLNKEKQKETAFSTVLSNEDSKAGKNKQSCEVVSCQGTSSHVSSIVVYNNDFPIKQNIRQNENADQINIKQINFKQKEGQMQEENILPDNCMKRHSQKYRMKYCEKDMKTISQLLPNQQLPIKVKHESVPSSNFHKYAQVQQENKKQLQQMREQMRQLREKNEMLMIQLLDKQETIKIQRQKSVNDRRQFEIEVEQRKQQYRQSLNLKDEMIRNLNLLLRQKLKIVNFQSETITKLKQELMHYKRLPIQQQVIKQEGFQQQVIKQEQQIQIIRQIDSQNQELHFYEQAFQESVQYAAFRTAIRVKQSDNNLQSFNSNDNF